MATIILYVPGITAKEAKQSAWMVPALSSGTGFLTLWLIQKLGKRFPKQNLIQSSTVILGKYLSKILGGGYILFFLVFSILIIRQFTRVISVSLLEVTPIWFLSLCLVLVGSYGAILGIEVIARSAQFVLPLFVGTFATIIFLALQDLEFKHLFPFLEGGFSPVLKASITPASWFGESIIVAFLLPHINKPKEMFRKGSYAILAAVFVLTGDILLTILIIGPELSASFNLPFWKLVRYLEVGRTFLRIETILIFLWISALVVKFTLIQYLGCITVAQVFGWKSHRKIVLAMGIILFITSGLWVTSSMELTKILNVFWPPFALFFEIGVPVFLLGMAWLRKRQGGKNP